MSSDSILPESLIRAYRETHYKVSGPARVILVVDQPSYALAELHRQHGVEYSAFITACNPFSAALSSAQNVRRQLDLADELRQRGLVFVDAIGQHPTNGWAGEPSFLVFGLALEAAKSLCANLEQNALVWSGVDAVPKLILLR